MKKIFFLVVVGIVTVSLIGCNNGVKNTISNDDGKSLSSNRSIDEKVALEGAANIDIELCAAEVSVRSYDGDEVKITGNLSEKSEGIDIRKDSNEISIIEKGYSIFNSSISDKDDHSRLDILIPSKFNGGFEFKQGVGKSEISQIKAKDIDIAGGVGELKCEGIKFDKLDLNSSVGKVNLNLKEKCGDIVIKGGVGKTSVKMVEVGGNLTYKGGVGAADITVPKNSPIRFITHKGVGNCKVDAKTSGKDDYTFDLKTGVGEISVHN